MIQIYPEPIAHMKRRKFIYQTSAGALGLFPVLNKLNISDKRQGPYLATGIKIGEVDQTSAIVWGRLTNASEPVGAAAPVPKVLYLDEAVGEWHPVAYFKQKYKQDRPDREVRVVYPEGYDVSMMEGAVPGSGGYLRVLYRKKGAGKWVDAGWKAADEKADYCVQFRLNGLEPATEYEVRVEAKGLKKEKVTASLRGKFATAVAADVRQPIRFMVTTCYDYHDQDDPGKGFKIYRHMQAMDPAFMVHTGDVLYYDHWAKDLAMAHWNWQRMFSLSSAMEFFRNVPCYFMKDDHDTWMNDCYPGSPTRFMGAFTFEQGVEVFRQQVPYGPVPYRSFRWGKDVQIWLVEGREFRSPNTMPDGPEKTIWGKQQMEWFKKSFAESDATFRVLISPTPIVGPDRPQKRDNHANSGFAHEGEQIRQFLRSQKNAFIVCGDRHWQYASCEKGSGLMEFACGPASNEHASGWPKNLILPEHRYLNIVGGYLCVDVQPDGAGIVFTHYGVNGDALHTEHFTAV